MERDLQSCRREEQLPREGRTETDLNLDSDESQKSDSDQLQRQWNLGWKLLF